MDRGALWDLTSLPVPVELLVYTVQEWVTVTTSGTRFARVLDQEVVWVHPEGSRRSA